MTKRIQQASVPASCNGFCEDLPRQCLDRHFQWPEQVTGKPRHSPINRYNKQEKPRRAFLYSKIHLEFILVTGRNHLGRHLLRRSQLRYHPEKQIFPRISGIAQRRRRIKVPHRQPLYHGRWQRKLMDPFRGRRAWTQVQRWNTDFKRYTLDNIPSGTAQNNIKAILITMLKTGNIMVGGLLWRLL